MHNLIANLKNEIKQWQEFAEFYAKWHNEEQTKVVTARIEGLQTALIMAELALNNNLKDA